MEPIKQGMWQMQAMYHKNQIIKVKEQTGATHVSHIKNEIKDGEKINCLYIKNGEKELKYGGPKSFFEFSPEDYKEAIKEFNKL